jgi:hypothetical protein
MKRMNRMKRMNYKSITPYLVQAVKEQQETIEKQGVMKEKQQETIEKQGVMMEEQQRQIEELHAQVQHLLLQGGSAAA